MHRKERLENVPIIELIRCEEVGQTENKEHSRHEVDKVGNDLDSGKEQISS